MKEALFDYNALKHHRERAQSTFDTRLFAHAATQLRERLTPLRITFSSVLDISPFHTTGLFPFFQDLFTTQQWTEAKTEHLSTQIPASYDLILSALEAHWIEDLPLFVQLIRALLKPGGLFLCTFWGGETLKELRHALFHAEGMTMGGASPRVIPMLPLEEGVRLLQSVDFTLPVADQETLTVLYPNLTKLFHHLRSMGETNALWERKRGSRAFFQEAERFYHKTYATPQNELPATAQLITLTAWAPGPGQPSPLRRGSATHNLMDVLD